MVHDATRRGEHLGSTALRDVPLRQHASSTDTIVSPAMPSTPSTRSSSRVSRRRWTIGTTTDGTEPGGGQGRPLAEVGGCQTQPDGEASGREDRRQCRRESETPQHLPGPGVDTRQQLACGRVGGLHPSDDAEREHRERGEGHHEVDRGISAVEPEHDGGDVGDPGVTSRRSTGCAASSMKREAAMTDPTTTAHTSEIASPTIMWRAVTSALSQ